MESSSSHSRSFEPTLDRESPNRSIWAAINEAGVEHLKELILAIRTIAPEPGSVVLLDAQNLLKNSDPSTSLTLFSAIDVRTHLQLARLYLTGSLASSMDFLGYAQQGFPFAMKRLVTKPTSAFVDPTLEQSKCRFTIAAYQLGIHHTLLRHQEKDLFEFLDRFFFQEQIDEPLDAPAERALLSRLDQFLQFHNRFRSFPSLGGKTALETLRSLSTSAFPTLRILRA